MDNLIILGLFCPLIGFLILSFLSSYIGRKAAGVIGCLTIGISFVSFLSLLYIFVSQNLKAENVTLFNWISYGAIKADFALRLDHLSLLMTLIITGVGFLIHVYSIGYMEHDEDYCRYFACMNLFVFAMLLLVLASNLLLLFVGWEGVGLASYLLIGYYYYRPSAAQAATKAFVINRIGDAGFLIGLLLTFHLFGTSDISDIIKLSEEKFVFGMPIVTILTLLFFIGAIGKSAQLPLYTWLPDAMEGPTPVSALIHAATMVTAGVYLVVRLHPIFMLAPITMKTIGIIGGTTSLFAAVCALGQTDLKRVLAYSTVSQLGLMFLACGAGAFYSAMFHLTTHAFVKATLFLSAGIVVHAMNGSTNMEKMGGLKKILPKTNWFFLIGLLALSGIPPLAAFFSKDLILEQEYLSGFETLFYIGLAASILTGVYLTRAYCLTFLGKSRIDSKVLVHAKEGPPVMWIPVAILTFLCIVGGILGFTFGKGPLLEDFLSEVGTTVAERELESGYIFTPETGMAVGGGLIGIFLAFIIYTRFYDQLGNTFQFLKRSLYVDEIYDFIFVNPLKAMTRVIDDQIEPKIFEGSIVGAGSGALKLSAVFKKIQNGEIRSYVALMVLGAVFLMVYYVW